VAGVREDPRAARIRYRGHLARASANWSGAPNGRALLGFASGVVGSDDAELARSREALRAEMGDVGIADASAVAANFERIIRIADATGIEFGGRMDSFTEEVPRTFLSTDSDPGSNQEMDMSANPPPPVSDIPFTIGIEEEYLIVDRESRDLIQEAPPEMIEGCRERLGGQVTTELMQCQIEVGTVVCETVQAARADLSRLRRTVSGVVRRHGFEIIAASTHPFGQAREIRRTRKKRYDSLAAQLQEIARRLLVSGMHVHVGLGDDELRNDLIGQVSYVLPHFLALSTSSPFWQGNDTGLKSYRIAVWDGMPRTGLPERFESFAEYERHVRILVDCGVIRDSSEIWWDIRPSLRFPTLEMRIPDLCTRLDDAICIAALYRCWLRLLWRLKRSNQRWRRYPRLLIEENRWRARRFGIDEGLIDFGRSEMVPCSELMDEIIELVREDAEHFGCVDEIEHARAVIARGTSAHRQIETYRAALAAGAHKREALAKVVDMLVEETLSGCE